MVEDLISTGKSVLEAAERVEATGAEVIGVAAIFSYELEEGVQAFREQRYPLRTLTSYRELVEVAVQNDELLPYKETLEKWYKDPVKWSNEAL